ncbi:MAG: hypothetical protein AB1757_07955 [Acidobacteriota bacterium]
MNCQLCGVSAETRYVAFYQNIGALIIRFHKSIKGELCKNCIHEQFWSHTLITSVLGWWGVISLIVTPFFLINNIARYLMCLTMSPVNSKPSTEEPLTAEAFNKIHPYANQIIDRLNGGSSLDEVAREFAPRAGVQPAEVKLYIVALADAARQAA